MRKLYAGVAAARRSDSSISVPFASEIPKNSLTKLAMSAKLHRIKTAWGIPTMGQRARRTAHRKIR